MVNIGNAGSIQHSWMNYVENMKTNFYNNQSRTQLAYTNSYTGLPTNIVQQNYSNSMDF